MTSLTGKTPKTTYKDLLQVSNANSGIDATLRPIEDGEGTQSPLQISSDAVNIASGLQVGGQAATTAGTTLLTAANAAAQRTALGLATVATTGSYADLSGKPSIPSIGTAGSKAASDVSKSTVASVSGSTTANHIATFADTSGTVQDGGTLGSLASQDADDVEITGGSITGLAMPTGDSDVATKAYVDQEVGGIGANVVPFTGTAKTLALSDASTIQACNSASAQTVTIPLNIAVAFDADTLIQFEQNGAGSLTISATSGVTLNGVNGGTFGTSSPQSGFYLRKNGTDSWFAVGAVAATTPPGGSSGQVQFNSGGSFGGLTIGGDAALNTGTGALTVTKTGGVAFAASATTDTTNAANIGSGTIPAARLPNPSATTLGGVQSKAAVTNQFLTSISTSGVPASAQPAAADISGLAASATTDATNASNISSGTLPAARLPNPSATTLGGVQSKTVVTNQFLTSISTSGVPASAQPSASNITGLAASATTDTTVATNITSGTLPAARLPVPTSSTLGGVQSKAAVANQFLTSISTSGVPTSAQPTTSDISGLGSIATQAASSVAITGGAIDGVTIGATAPVQAQTYSPINAQTGTTYTLVLADNGKWVTLNNASAIALTVPPNSSVAFPVGSEITLEQLGAGAVTITAGVGVTINKMSTLVASGQYAVMGLKKTATDTWTAFGALS